MQSLPTAGKEWLAPFEGGGVQKKFDFFLHEISYISSLSPNKIDHTRSCVLQTLFAFNIKIFPEITPPRSQSHCRIYIVAIVHSLEKE